MFNTIFFKSETSAGKQDISLARSREIGDTISDKDDQRDGAVLSCQLLRGGVLVLINRKCFVVTELGVMSPNRLPF